MRRNNLKAIGSPYIFGWSDDVLGIMNRERSSAELLISLTLTGYLDIRSPVIRRP